MSTSIRTLKGGGVRTTDATPTKLFCFQIPATGSFTLSGVIIGRKDGGKTLAFNMFTSGDAQGGVPATAQSALCPTSPADGGATQLFQPLGVSSANTGAGRFDNDNVIAFGPAQGGRVPVEISTVGLGNPAAANITWSWNLKLAING
jgi:hypothetical protein